MIPGIHEKNTPDSVIIIASKEFHTQSWINKLQVSTDFNFYQ